MDLHRALAVSAAAVALVPAASAEAQSGITLTGAGADAQRRPFARWTPSFPIVNIAVSTRPVRGADTAPAIRYRVQSGSYGILEDGPSPFWRGAEPLVPGVYYTAIDGDGPSQGALPWTAFTRFRVPARKGEWTGATSQRRYLRFTRPRARVLRRLAFSVYARGLACQVHSSFSIPGDIRLRRDGGFSIRLQGVWNLPHTSTANIRVSGRVRRSFARGVVRVDDLFEGCSSGRVRWSARRR